MLAPDLRRPFILAAIMISSFMIAIEATIVATAMPQIVGQLGKLNLYAWVFSAFLLAQTATTVVFGKLSDLYGRRPVVLGGIIVFLLGSVLCGFATSMPMLIAFRLIQGLGAGAVQPVTQTLVGDLYPGAERGKVQGWLASVWGVSSVAGPLAGGLIIQKFSWAWIFWINIPIGLAAAGIFYVFLREEVRREERSVDAAGAALFAIAIAALMVALTDAGATPGLSIASLALFALALFLFLLQERRARDPMVAIALWSHRPIATSNIVCLLSGMAVIGLTSFLPMYVQAVMRHSALVAGFALTAMLLGWPIAATFAARRFHRFGLRPILIFGSGLLPLGAAAFVILGPDRSPLIAAFGSLIMGFGMGFLTTAGIVIIQSSVGWAERGSATASNLFSRSLGSTLGATLLGALLNLSLAHSGREVTSDRIRALIEHRAGAPGDETLRLALADGLHITFWAVFLLSLATLLFAFLVPNVRLQQAEAD
jgi:EmrB/QacA subfamily drug resistance transporter